MLSWWPRPAILLPLAPPVNCSSCRLPATLEAELDAAATPVIALAISADGKQIAASSIRGAVAIIGHDSRKVERTLVGPGLPAWSAVFLPDNRGLLTGGGDRVIRRWDSQTGEQAGEVAMGAPADPLAAFEAEPGAQVFRACVACHTLRAQDGPRAGPTLSGLFGRRIATAPGYDFSPALKQLDIVWTPRDPVQAVRTRAGDLHSRQQNARTARRRTGPARTHSVSRKRPPRTRQARLTPPALSAAQLSGFAFLPAFFTLAQVILGGPAGARAAAHRRGQNPVRRRPQPGSRRTF